MPRWAVNGGDFGPGNGIGRSDSHRQNAHSSGANNITAPRRYRFLISALAFELGLGLVAILAAWLVGFDWQSRLIPERGRLGRSIVLGLLAILPLFAALVWLQRSPPKSLHPLLEVLHGQVVPLFRGLSIVELALLAAAAGVGEELLFRGAQCAIATWVGGSSGTAAGLILGSVTFGACHWLNNSYAVVTLIVGFYLGLLMILGGQIISPIIAHGGYDLLALVYLTRIVHQRSTDSCSQRKSGDP
jgi:hypothetical protein